MKIEEVLILISNALSVVFVITVATALLAAGYLWLDKKWPNIFKNK